MLKHLAGRIAGSLRIRHRSGSHILGAAGARIGTPKVLSAVLLSLGILLPGSGLALEPGCVAKDDQSRRGLPWPYSQFGCSILAQQDLGPLPEVPLYWHVDQYPDLQGAIQAKGERSSVVRLQNQFLLFTIAEREWLPAPAGKRLHQVGPLPVEKQKAYTAIYSSSLILNNHASGVAAFSGPLGWFVQWGAMCIETPAGKMTLKAGESGVLRKAETPLRVVTTSEATTGSHMGVALVETSMPIIVGQSGWTPNGECQGGYPKLAVIQRNDLQTDKSFEAFLLQLRTLAEQADLSSFSQQMARGFFWERDSDKAFDSAALPLDSFRQALGLSPGSRRGTDVGRPWRRLRAMLALQSWTWSTSRPGVACGPAEPSFDRSKLNAAQSRIQDHGAWAYRVGTATVREGTSPDSEIVGSVSNEIVQVLSFPATPAGTPKFSQIMLSDGRVGVVHGENQFWPLNSDQLCFQKEEGEWRIAGYIGVK